MAICLLSLICNSAGKSLRRRRRRVGASSFDTASGRTAELNMTRRPPLWLRSRAVYYALEGVVVGLVLRLYRRLKIDSGRRTCGGRPEHDSRRRAGAGAAPLDPDLSGAGHDGRRHHHHHQQQQQQQQLWTDATSLSYVRLYGDLRSSSPSQAASPRRRRQRRRAEQYCC